MNGPRASLAFWRQDRPRCNDSRYLYGSYFERQNWRYMQYSEPFAAGCASAFYALILHFLEAFRRTFRKAETIKMSRFLILVTLIAFATSRVGGDPTAGLPTEKPPTKAPKKKPVAKVSLEKPATKVPTKKPLRNVPTKKQLTRVPTRKPNARLPPAKTPVTKLLSKKPVNTLDCSD